MSRLRSYEWPSLGQGIALAAIMAVAGSIIWTGLRPALPATQAGFWLTTLLSGSYGLYLLGCSRHAPGRLVAAVGWCVAAVTAAWLIDSLALLMVVHAALIWLLRTLYFHRTVLAALADLGLCALGLATMAWAATQTASLLLSLWCLFLTQALFVRLPRGKFNSATPANDPNQAFDTAQHSAEAALHRLSTLH